MQVIYDYPPNYKEIAKHFDIVGNESIVFTYGYKLFVPGGEKISLDKYLLEHEKTHAIQQTKMGVEEWWKKYLEDRDFRFTQELEAYRNQYRSMGSLSLRHRDGYLDHIVRDLSGKMYGNMISPEDARKLITDGIVLKGHGTPHKSKPNARKLKKRQRQNRKKGRR